MVAILHEAAMSAYLVPEPATASRSLLGLAGLVWLAENIATYTNIWLYPSQVEQWHWVGLGKVGSWYLLLLLSLVLVLAVMGKRTSDGVWRLHDKGR